MASTSHAYEIRRNRTGRLVIVYHQNVYSLYQWTHKLFPAHSDTIRHIAWYACLAPWLREYESEMTHSTKLRFSKFIWTFVFHAWKCKRSLVQLHVLIYLAGQGTKRRHVWPVFLYYKSFESFSNSPKYIDGTRHFRVDKYQIPKAPASYNPTSA